jgi:hypothetical protein
MRRKTSIMIRYQTIAIFWLTAMLLAACAGSQFSASNQPTPTPTQPTPAWLERWLESPACEPPCLEGITPGKTTLEQAKSILQSMPDFQITEVGFEYLTLYAEGNVWITLYTKGNDAIQVISLHTGYLPVEKIVSRYGFPMFLVPEVAIDPRGNTCFILPYPSYGMALFFLAADPFEAKLELQPETEITGISLYVSRFEGDYGSACGTQRRPPIPFKGYGEYEIPDFPWGE